MNRFFLVVFLFITTTSFAQYQSTRISNDNRFYFHKSDVHFATYDEMLIADTIISGYIIKDLRGTLLATVQYKAGREIADSTNPTYTTAYTEIYFAKNILACQMQGIVCRQDLRSVFESLLFNDSTSNTLPKNFTYKYELDYAKVETFCNEREIVYTDKIEAIVNPVNEYYKFIEFCNNNRTCNKKGGSKKAGSKQQAPVKYVPKKN